MTRPPRLAERLLSSLGADPYLRDVVLGDLAEEFAERVPLDGERSARQWYVAEAIRNIPFFLRSWRRGARWREVTRLLGIAASTYTLMLVATGLVAATGYALWSALHLPHIELRNLLLTSSSWVFLILLWIGAIYATLAGAIAAWLDERTPVISAMTFGLLWMAVNTTVAIGVSHGDQMSARTGLGPLWYRAVLPLVIVAGTIAGSLVRIALRKTNGHPDQVAVRETII